MTQHAYFDVEEVTPDSITIRDLDLPGHKSITNDVEDVVRRLSLALKGKRLFYYDTLGNLDEILLNDKCEFMGFAPGPNRSKS